MGQDKTEYVPLYVTPEDKRRIEASRDNYALQMEIVKEIFATDKSFLKTEMEQVQDELLKYRALLLTIRQEYFAVQKEHSERLEAFWAEFYDGIPKLKNKVTLVKNELEPIIKGVLEIKTALESVQTYQMDKIMGVIKHIQGLGGEEVAMFHMLVENFKLNPATKVLHR